MRAVLDIVSLFRAARFAAFGVWAAARHQAAFRRELILAAVLVPIGVWLGDGGVERALLLGSVALVLIVELVNSAVETAVDRIGLAQHELSGRAKDLGAAAVCMSLINWAVVWGFVLLG
jgi:diacylglycerol kinase (ATP)